MKKTRQLVASLVAIVICFAMLLGTTYAWFTDSVINTNNIIKSGNVDVELYHTNSVVTDEKVDGSTKLFVNVNGDEILWESGASTSETFTIKNEGSLALKYEFRIKALSKTLNEKNGSLLDVLALTVNGEDKKFGDTFNGTITAGGAPVTYEAKINWASTANDNDYMNLKVLLGIELVATQDYVEVDGSGNPFDVDAACPNVSSDATLVEDQEAVLETKGENSIKATLPAEVVKALKDSGVTSISLAHTDPVVENDKVIFESIEVVDQDGNIVDLESLNPGADVTITLPAQEVFAEGARVVIMHDGEEVATATVGANGVISYDVEHLCKVEIASAKWSAFADTAWYNDTDKAFELKTAEELAGLAQLVNEGKSFSGKTVKLANDIDLVAAQWVPIGTSSKTFQGTFDGQDNTIKNLNCDMKGKSYVGLFGMTTNGEIKNLKVENAIVTGYLAVGVVAGSPYTSKYTNITLVGHVEVNGMAYVGGVGGRNAYANWTDITVDVDETSYVHADSVENGTAYRTYVGGVIGFMGEGGHVVSNVNSNIDVKGSTIDVGGIVGIAHYGNVFKNCAATGDVEVYGASAAEDAEEIGGIAGVWHNESGHTVTFENCSFKGKLTANITEGVNLTDNTIHGNAYSSTGTGELIIINH